VHQGLQRVRKRWDCQCLRRICSTFVFKPCLCSAHRYADHKRQTMRPHVLSLWRKTKLTFVTSLDESTDFFECGPRLRNHWRQKMPYVRHARP
jgi:hypothetical protein